MEIEQVIAMIGNFGFPIVMCLLFFYYMVKLQEQHKEELSELRATIENNTEAILKLSEKIN